MIYKAIINEDQEFEVRHEDMDQLDVVKKGDAHFHLLIEGKGHIIRLVEADYESRTFSYEVDGHPLKVELKTPLEVQIDEMGYETSASAGDSEIRAPMPGLVLDILVQEGDMVSKGAPLVILEAMKMENVIIAAHDARIEKVHVEKGASVEKSQLLLEIS